MSSKKVNMVEQKVALKKWEVKCLIIENVEKLLCLVCQKTVSAAKE